MRSSELRTSASRFLRLALLLLVLQIAATGMAPAAPRNGGETEAPMDYVAHMQQMLQVLGCYRPPVYASRQDHVVNGVNKQGVTYYKLTLTKITTRRSFDFQTRRENINDAIQETARLAVLHLARTHAAELAGTVFRLYPAAGEENPRLQRPLVDGEEDATVAQLARFALAQACFAQRTAAELTRTQAALDAAQYGLRRTRAELKSERERGRAKDASRKRLRSKLRAARKRIVVLEDAFFADSPNEEDLMMEDNEAPPVQVQAQAQPQVEDAGSQAPGEVEEEARSTLCYTRRRRRDSK